MSKSNSCEAVLENLPWFVNQTLPAEEMLSVRGHLKDCPSCSAELEWLSSVQASLDEITGDAEAPAVDATKHTDGFEQLRARIAQEQKRRDRRRMLLAASALLAVATLTGSLLTSYLLEPKFQTASDAQRPVERVIPVEVRFAAGTSLDSLRSIMQTTGAVLVEGPDAEGRVVLELPVETGGSREQALLKLQADPAVLQVTDLRESTSED